MEWTAPGIVLSAAPYGESGAVIHVLTEQHGAWRGLARGGQGRRQSPLWQPGNLVSLRWVARLADQLGTLTGEPVHASAAFVLAAPDALSMLASCCAVADGALPEREAHKPVFDGLLSLVTRLSLSPDRASGCRADLLRWERDLLAELGFGLDLSACAVTGASDDLVYVSPRSGRAVSRAGAGEWAGRLLTLPEALLDDTIAHISDPDWRDGLRLTGHFLDRDVFGNRHRPLPAARVRLADRAALSA